MTDQHWGPTISGDIVVIGGGSAGIGLLASLLKRDPHLNIILIEPSDQHCYQPAWTLVGGGAYDLKKTRRWLMYCPTALPGCKPPSPKYCPTSRP